MKRLIAVIASAVIAASISTLVATSPAIAATNDTATFLAETPYLQKPVYSKLATGYSVCAEFEAGKTRADAVTQLLSEISNYTTAIQVVDSAADYLCSDVAPVAQLRVRLESWSAPHTAYAREIPGNYLFNETGNTEYLIDRTFSVSGNGEYWAYVGSTNKPSPDYSLRCEMWLDGVLMVSKSDRYASTVKCNFTSP